MIVGKQQITEYFQDSQKPYFAIFNKGKIDSGNAIRRNDKEEKEYDFTAGLEAFEKILSLLGYGEYILLLNAEKDASKKGRLEMAFKIPMNEGKETDSQNNNIAGIVSTGITKEDAEKIADERFYKLKMEDENKDLKTKLAVSEKEVKDLQGQVSKPMSDLIGAVVPHIPQLLGSFFGSAQAAVAAPLVISGATPTSTGIGDEDRQQIFQDFITAIEAARPLPYWLQTKIS
jgi:hypothetical protein